MSSYVTICLSILTKRSIFFEDTKHEHHVVKWSFLVIG